VRFLVDQCVPEEVARWLRSQGHQAWTAFDANLDDAEDRELIAYASGRNAILVTTNRDCALLARRLRSGSVVWLKVLEVDARSAMKRATDWLTDSTLPEGRVLQVPKNAHLKVLNPKRF